MPDQPDYWKGLAGETRELDNLGSCELEFRRLHVTIDCKYYVKSTDPCAELKDPSQTLAMNCSY